MKIGDLVRHVYRADTGIIISYEGEMPIVYWVDGECSRIQLSFLEKVTL